MSVTGAWGRGVSDGQLQFEICTSSCRTGLYGARDGQLAEPSGVGVGGSGDVYVADGENARVEEFRRQGTNLIVSWSRTADTASYAILAKLPRDRSELFALPARQHTVLIPDVLTGDRGTIVITAIDQTGCLGPSAHFSF